MHACIVTWMCAKRMQRPECRKLRTEELRGGRDREAAVQTKIKQVDNRGALIISSCMEIA